MVTSNVTEMEKCSNVFALISSHLFKSLVLSPWTHFLSSAGLVFFTFFGQGSPLFRQSGSVFSGLRTGLSIGSSENFKSTPSLRNNKKFERRSQKLSNETIFSLGVN